MIFECGEWRHLIFPHSFIYLFVQMSQAVAFGAAVQGAILGGVYHEAINDVILIDAIPLSLGIETVGGVMTKLIPKGTAMPSKKGQTFSTNQDNQPAVLIQEFEGERTMSRDNHLLGKFELTGLPPAPRGVPQIDVTFQVDANGLLQVQAVDKGSGKAENISITADKGRLSEEEIERMVQEAEQYAEEDRLVKERIDAKNGLESYLKNTLEDGAEKLSAEDRKDLADIVDETLDWMDDNPAVEKEECLEKQKEVEQIANPIMRNFYSNGGGGDDGYGSGGDDDFGDDEL